MKIGHLQAKKADANRCQGPKRVVCEADVRYFECLLLMPDHYWPGNVPSCRNIVKKMYNR